MGVNTHGELAHSQPSTVTGGVTLDVSEYPPTHTITAKELIYTILSQMS